MDKSNLAEEIKRLNRNITQLVKHHSMTRAFFRGVFTGLGSVMGATIVVGILALALNNVQFIPVIGDWVAQITEYVQYSTTR